MAEAKGGPGLWTRYRAKWLSLFGGLGDSIPVEVRAASFLRDLEGEAGPTRDLPVLQLGNDHEVAGDDENANLEAVRAVQVRLLALADEYRVVEARMEERLRKAPIPKLFAAIIAQARIDGATEIAIEYRAVRKDVFAVQYLIEREWVWAMDVPNPLFGPFAASPTLYAMLRPPTSGSAFLTNI